jgi:hypothetical protein
MAASDALISFMSREARAAIPQASFTDLRCRSSTPTATLYTGDDAEDDDSGDVVVEEEGEK